MSSSSSEASQSTHVVLYTFKSPRNQFSTSHPLQLCPPSKDIHLFKKRTTPKISPEPATPKSSNFTPLGHFSLLPREIRDEIYSHICRQGSPFEFKDYDSSLCQHRRRWRGQGLSMLQVSRAIREEFSIVLFSKGVFRIWDSTCQPRTQYSKIPFMDQISNIEISLDLLHMFHESESDPWRLLSLYKGDSPSSATDMGEMSYFRVTSATRNICTVRLHRCGPKTLSLLLSSPVMHALSQLKNFKTVRLTYSSHASYWLEKGKTLRHAREAFNGKGTCPEFSTLVLLMSRTLEQSLGSFVASRGRQECGEPRLWNQRVTFHPRGLSIKEVERLEA